MRYASLLALLYLFPGLVQPQSDTIVLSRDQLVSSVLKQNLELSIANFEKTKSIAQVESSDVLFLPDLMLSYSAMSTDNPLMVFGSKLNQERVNNADFNPLLLNDPGRLENFSVRFEVRQPIVNMDFKYLKQAAQVKLEAAEFQIERMRDGLVLQADQLYLELQLLYKKIDVLKFSKTRFEEDYSVAQKQYDQGLLQRSDLLGVGLAVSQM